MDQFLGVFLDEAKEQIALLEQDILLLETEPSPELLNGIFRAAHTLKGSSRAMGFDAVGELTHALEDVFDSLRQGRLTAGAHVIEALFAGVDLLKAMCAEIAEAGASTLDSAEQTRALRATLGGVGPAQGSAASAAATSKPGAALVLSEAEQQAVQEALDGDYGVYQLTVEIVPDCVMKSVRALMVMQALELVGSVVATAPSLDALNNDAFDSSFEALVISDSSADRVSGAAGGVTDVASVHCRQIGDEPVETESPISEPDTPLPAECGAETVEQAGSESTPSAAGSGGRAAISPAATVRVDVARLDSLLNLVGELVIDRTRISQLAHLFERQFQRSDLVEQLVASVAHVDRITDALQDEIMKARMLPIGSVFNRFPRMIRDLAHKLGKDVQLVLEGMETELDRSVIEVIGDPLTHMLRNSVDHGIEEPGRRASAGKPATGSIFLRARHQDHCIVVEVEDDGEGMDPAVLRAKAVRNGILTPEAAGRLSESDSLNLIFAPGFTTVDVVSDVSGRGVGMDIVRSSLERIGATIEIDSVPGRGTRIAVRLPLTLAIIHALLVTVDGAVYAVPLAAVLETVRLQADDIHRVNHRDITLHRGSALPLLRLRDALPLCSVAGFTDDRPSRPAGVGSEPASVGAGLQLCAEAGPLGPIYMVIVGQGQGRVGLVVDTIAGEQEVVIKSLGKFIGEIPGVSGATILGDGRVALIVDVAGIIQIALSEKGTAHAA
jgi:two-component system, chemotaxis family, sensor kinase CheA